MILSNSKDVSMELKQHVFDFKKHHSKVIDVTLGTFLMQMLLRIVCG